jgi:diguanylate cyclase
MYKNIIDVINLGIVAIDSEYRLIEWNRWMEIHSGIQKKDILNTNIFDNFPQLNNTSFIRGCKAVLNFGNIVFFSQKLHNYLFPVRTTGYYSKTFDFMQQSCSMAPATKEDGSVIGIVISVQDVTESVYLENSLKKTSLQDSLTGISNRRHLNKRLFEEFMRHKRYNRALSLVMIDIDNFKNINDTYGHQFGDTVLKEISGAFSSIMRIGEIIARYGGEEFCAVLPETDIDGAKIFSERLRMLVSELEIKYNEETSVKTTVSIGIAGLDKTVNSVEELVGNADNALYKSKQNGKNMVSVYSLIENH